MKSPPAAPGASVTMPTGRFIAIALRGNRRAGSGEKWLGLLDRRRVRHGMGRVCASFFASASRASNGSTHCRQRAARFGADEVAQGRSRRLQEHQCRALPMASTSPCVIGRTFEKKEMPKSWSPYAFEEGVWRPTGYFIR